MYLSSAWQFHKTLQKRIIAKDRLWIDGASVRTTGGQRNVAMESLDDRLAITAPRENDTGVTVLYTSLSSKVVAYIIRTSGSSGF